MPDTLRYLYAPFVGKRDDQGRIVEGYVSSGDQDLDGQIVDQDWLKSELPAWLLSYGNIREQHDPRRAVGKAQSVDVDSRPGPYLAARIVDDDAWRKVKAGVYNGFSIGIKNPQIVRDAAAPNGRIAGGRLIEISIVDRPANDAARFVVVKRAGPHAWKDMQTGAVLEERAATAITAGPHRTPVGATPVSPAPSAVSPAPSAVSPAPSQRQHNPVSPTPAERMTTMSAAADNETSAAEPPATPGAQDTGRGQDAALYLAQGEAPPAPFEYEHQSSDHRPLPRAGEGARRAGEGPRPPTPPPTTKAAPSFASDNPSPRLPTRPADIGNEVAALLREAAARLEALAGQTDADRDGDVDTPANTQRGGEPLRDPSFQQARPTPDQAPAHPAPLDLGFSSTADLHKYIADAIAQALAAQAHDLTKSASAGVESLETATEVAKLAGGIAKGLAALAGQAEAATQELRTLKAAVTRTEADLAQVKHLAQPLKGALFAVDKGVGLDPDRVSPEAAYRTFAAGANDIEWLAKQVSQLSEEQRMELARQAYSAFAPNRG